jgi:hypothetical protein
MNDQCVRGICIGVIDYCKYWNVTCEPVTVCTLDDGVCHPENGMCTYGRRPNGYPCDDGRINTVNDVCSDGFCSGNMVDVCIERAVNCSVELPNDCHAPGTCDTETGLCSLAVALTGKSCDDGDPTTANESCIDGVCVGQPLNWQALKFETMGDGACTDRNGFQTASYMGDLPREHDCEQACRDDPQCIAFDYSPPMCRIYGTIRTQAPENGYFYFMLGTVPAAVVVEEAQSTQGQRDSICRKKSWIGDAIEIDSSGQIEGKSVFQPLVMVCFFAALGILFVWHPLLKSLRVLCCCRSPIPESNMVENRIEVQSASPKFSSLDNLNSPDSPGSQDLRMLAASPASPDSLPFHLDLPPDSPQTLTPSQALSPMVQTPVTLSPVSYAWGETETPTTSPDGKKTWSRPGAIRKMALEGEVPVAPANSALHMKDGTDVFPAPTTVATGAQIGQILRTGINM